MQANVIVGRPSGYWDNFTLDVPNRIICDYLNKKDVSQALQHWFYASDENDSRDIVFMNISEITEPEKEMKIDKLHYEDGKMEIAVDHPMVSIFSQSLIDLFKEGKGVNYIGLTIADPRDLEQYELLIQKKSGKSVAEINSELKKEIHVLEERIRGLEVFL